MAVGYRYGVIPIDGALSVRLLGPLEVLAAGRPIVVDTRKALAIVALVAAERRPFARDELAAMFWPEADDEAARGSLRRTLSALRTATGGTGLAIGRNQVAVDPATSIDLEDFERLSTSGSAADLEAAVALARGPFMAGFALRDSPSFDEWQALRAVRFDRTIADVLDRLAAARFAAGDLTGALDAARRRVALDPLDELGQRRLIELLAATGDRGAAIRQYRELVALFDRELGVAPLRETTSLYDAIRENRIAGNERPAVTTGPPVAPGLASSAAVGRAAGLTPLVGRDGELAAIDAAWRVAGRNGRVVLVEGEAGIGKTRLGEAAAAAVEAAGGTVLAARGYPGEAAIAYGPIAGLLRAGTARPDAPARLGILDETARIEIGRLVDLPAALRVRGPAAPPGASARVRLLDALVEALSSLVAGDVPGLLWVDDLHLADDPSLEALAYLARRLEGRPLLLLLAWRREDLAPIGVAAADDLARLPWAMRLELPRLDRDAIAAIVRAARPDGGSADALIDAIASDSEGLPLHVVAALASDDAPRTRLPRSVQALMLERLASVGETAGQVLSAAAVIGRSFDLATVRYASGRSEEETVAAMEELVRRGIVREVPEATGPSITYDFIHGRMRDVAYESSSLGRRRLLHRRTAEALRLDPSASGRDDRARHALVAAHEQRAGRPAEAAESYLRAADQAEAVFANREAIEHLESAIALRPADAADAYSRIGELRSRLGEYPAAIAALETSAAIADPACLPGIEIALGRVHRRRGDLAAAASHVAAALGTPGLADSVRARALVEASLVALRAGDLGAAGTAAIDAREVAARVGDPHLSGVAERLVGLVARSRGELAEAQRALERSVTLARDDPDPTAAVAATTALALTLAASGAIEAALEASAAAIQACRHIGDRHLEAAVENHVADILHDAGRPDESMAHLKRAVGLFAEIGEGDAQPEPGIWALAAW